MEQEPGKEERESHCCPPAYFTPRIWKIGYKERKADSGEDREGERERERERERGTNSWLSLFQDIICP